MALVRHGSVDRIEYGRYVARAKKAMLATTDSKQRPSVVTSQWPVMVQDATGAPVRDAAVVISNDSDLSLPLSEARQLVPVGLVNPGPDRAAWRGLPRAASSELMLLRWWGGQERGLRGRVLVARRVVSIWAARSSAA